MGAPAPEMRMVARQIVVPVFQHHRIAGRPERERGHERRGAPGEAARGALERAERSMEGAEEALRNDDLAGALEDQADAMEALREGMRALDAVVYTHAHLDHVVGFDELRAFCWRKDGPLPLHATEECMATLKRMFGWAFSEENVYLGYVKPDPRVIRGAFSYGELKVTPLPGGHGSVETIGYLFEPHGARSIAYLPDVKRIPHTTMDSIRRVDVLVVDSLRPSPHPTHFSLTEALEAIHEAEPDEAWLTHLGHENDHGALEKELPRGVRVAWDGLRIEL